MNKKICILTLLFAFILAACGGGAPSTTIDVTMTDFSFTPNAFSVPAGEQITLNAINNGAVVHNFVIMKLGASAGEAFDDADVPNVYWEVEIQPGGSIKDTFTAPTEAGDYQVVCRTPGHISSGMIATLNVVAGN